MIQNKGKTTKTLEVGGLQQGGARADGKEGTCVNITELMKTKGWFKKKIEQSPLFFFFFCFHPSDRSRCPSCCLLNLLFKDEDALSLLWRQHGDLFRGQLQDLHDQGGLKRDDYYLGETFCFFCPYCHLKYKIKCYKALF